MPKTRVENRVAQSFVTFVERYYPDSFVFVILLTGMAFAMVFMLTDAGVGDALRAWGGGLPSLLNFMAQLAITLITAHALAHTDFVAYLLQRFANLPRREWQAYSLVVFVASMGSLIAWSLGLIVGGLIARRVAVEGRKRGLRLDYPLIVASAYAGMVVWHMGYSGTAPLFVATAGHQFESITGIIPVTETLFTSWNLIAIVVTVAAITLLCPLMRPPTDRIVEITFDDSEVSSSTDVTSEDSSIRQLLDHNRVMSMAFGVLLVAFLYTWFVDEGFALNLNIVNWTFLAAGLLLARCPAHYVRLVSAAGQTVGAVLIQYPFYAGIMGLMLGTGLVNVIAGWFTQFATADSLPFWAFISGGLVNMFIPSGGGQWAVQGPIFLEAANAMGTEPAKVVMGIAYGDQWTNMIQPFWTIPLLAIAGLHVRQIMGYTFVVFLVTGVTLGLSIYLAG